MNFSQASHNVTMSLRTIDGTADPTSPSRWTNDTNTDSILSGNTINNASGSWDIKTFKSTADDVIGPLSLVITLVGIVGNIASIAVMSRRAFRNLPISIIIICLGVFDTLQLVMYVNTQKWFLALIQFDIKSLSTVSCKMFLWAATTSIAATLHMVVLISVDRFIAVFFPIKAKLIFSRNKARVSAIVVTAILATVEAGHAYHSHAIENGICVPNSKKDQLTDLLVSLYGIASFGLSTVLILGLNLAITIFVWVRKKRTIGSGAPSQMPASSVSLMLVGVITAHIILVLPNAVVFGMAIVLHEDIFETDNVALFIAFASVQLGLRLNSAINFFLYIFLGRKFRTEFIVMLKCKK